MTNLCNDLQSVILNYIHGFTILYGNLKAFTRILLKYPIGIVTANLKTHCSFNFSTKVFEFALQNANAFFPEINGNPRINNEARIRIYGSVTLSNGAIVRAISNFHNREWFNEVAVSMSSEESVICLKLFTNMLQ